MDAMPRVSIIILNWNGWKDTIECLESVYQITYPNYDVIVVDNGSENESVEKIKEYAEGKLPVKSLFFEYSMKNKPLRVIERLYGEVELKEIKEDMECDLPSNRKMILIKNDKNYGFAGGNNIAIEYTLKALSPEYILLLNNDTIVDGAFLEELVNVAELDKKIGFVGPKIYYYDYGGKKNIVNFAGGTINLWTGRSSKRMFNQIDTGDIGALSDVDYVEGSCILARTNVVNTIGHLNPFFFTYWEDTDWCMRAKNAGYRIVYVPTAKIWHKVSASNQGVTKEYYISRNRLKFVREYSTRIQLISFFAYFFGLEFWLYCGKLLCIKRNMGACISFIRGIVDGCR